jgi:hypothetical protein
VTNEKYKLDQKLKSLEEAIHISNLYRVCVQKVIESIRVSILPELATDRAFLIAENVKNSIVAEKKVENILFLPFSNGRKLTFINVHE